MKLHVYSRALVRAAVVVPIREVQIVLPDAGSSHPPFQPKIKFLSSEGRLFDLEGVPGFPPDWEVESMVITEK